MYRVLYKTYTLQFASCQRGTRQLVEMHSTGTAIGFFSRLQYRVLLEHTHTHTQAILREGPLVSSVQLTIYIP